MQRTQNGFGTAGWFVTLALALTLAGTGRAQTSLGLGSVPAFPGTTAAVPAGLRPSANGVVAMQFDVAFNSGKVSALEALRGERLTNHVIRSRQVAPGVERVLIYSLSNATMTGSNLTVASLPFAVASTEHFSSGPLTPGNVVLAKVDATRVAPVTASAGTIFVRAVNLLPDGQAQFFLPSEPDQTYVIQATTDLISWVDILTNTASGTFMDLLDTDALIYSHRFYRSAPVNASGSPAAAAGSAPNGR